LGNKSALRELGIDTQKTKRLEWNYTAITKKNVELACLNFDKEEITGKILPQGGNQRKSPRLAQSPEPCVGPGEKAEAFGKKGCLSHSYKIGLSPGKIGGGYSKAPGGNHRRWDSASLVADYETQSDRVHLILQNNRTLKQREAIRV